MILAIHLASSVTASQRRSLAAIDSTEERLANAEQLLPPTSTTLDSTGNHLELCSSYVNAHRRGLLNTGQNTSECLHWFLGLQVLLLEYVLLDASTGMFRC